MVPEEVSDLKPQQAVADGEGVAGPLQEASPVFDPKRLRLLKKGFREGSSRGKLANIFLVLFVGQMPFQVLKSSITFSSINTLRR